MSDDKLFRWNLKLHFTCRKCSGTVFVEDVRSEEIFCITCGDLLAKNRQEWPSDWDETASFGKLASEQSWADVVPISKPMDDLHKLRGTSRNTTPSTARSSSISLPDLTTLDIREIGKGHASITPRLESSQSETPLSYQIENSITVQPSLRIEIPQTESPHKSRNTPHSNDVELRLLASHFRLREETVPAANLIIRRVETEPWFARLSKSNNSMLLRVALFLACRQLGIPKTFSEFERDLKGSQKVHFHKQFKLFDATLKKDVFNSPTKGDSTSCPESPVTSFPASFSVADFIRSESKQLELSDTIQDRALEISKCPQIERLFMGKRPSLTAAVILSYAAECEQKYLGTKPFADAANISTYTLSVSQKALVKVVEEMSSHGQLPSPFCPRWNYPNSSLK